MAQRLKKLLLLTHVNPFSGHSGQSQRVRYTLKALQHLFDVTVVFGTYSHTQKEHFMEGFAQSGFQMRATVITGRQFFSDKIKAAFTEFGLGLKASNYFISKLFSVERLNSCVDFGDYHIVFFEYWHAYATARQLAQAFPNLITVCDTHNILSSTYHLYVRKHRLKKYLMGHFIKRYETVEFNAALPSFRYLIAINREEHLQLVQKFGAEKVLFCPMGVDLSAFDGAATYGSTAPFVVLYYGGLGSAHNQQAALQAYRRFVLPAIEQGLLVRYRIVGSKPPDGFADVFDASITEVVGFADRLVDAFAGVSLAIIPWVGRYGFRSRLIELAACGIPIFTTADAVWGMGFEHNNTAFVFNELDEVAFSQFTELYHNKALLRQVSDQAAALVRDQYDYKNTYEALGLLLQAIAQHHQ
jgi:glycosyltransferase involved in cell wall biosynthesis